MHIISKYDSSSSVSCILLLMNFQIWRSWETQYSSIGTVLDSIPLNVSRSRVSRETQKEATLIHSSMQRELRLRPFPIDCCKRRLSSSCETCASAWYGLPSATLTAPSLWTEVEDIVSRFSTPSVSYHQYCQTQFDFLPCIQPSRFLAELQERKWGTTNESFFHLCMFQEHMPLG